MADKSNAMTAGHALWQRVFREVAPSYPDIAATHYYIDALAMYMVLDPGQFEVIVTNNLFGDIITDLGAALQGGLGHGGVGQPPSGADVDVRAGPRIGAEVRRQEHREPDWRDRVGGADAGDARDDATKRPAIDAAVLSAVRENQVTQDIGGTLGTQEAGDVVDRSSASPAKPARPLATPGETSQQIRKSGVGSS